MANKKILAFLLQKMNESFKLQRYDSIRNEISENTIVKVFPWTPKRWDKFVAAVEDEFDLKVNFDGTLVDIANDIDYKYKLRFWGGGVWQPRTDDFTWTGWGIVDEIMKHEPNKVLDVGCGYNQFKQRIPNLTGIDKYNNCADYMVDIMDYNVDPDTYDAVIVFGSVNFGDYSDISAKMAKIFSLTAPGGRIYVRANTGAQHAKGPYIDLFGWNFELAHKIAKENSVDLLTLKQDTDHRIFLIYQKPTR